MILTKEQLKKELNRIKRNSYMPDEGDSIPEYAEAMLQHIGDPDPELRDDLIYEILCEWICEKEFFSDDELRSMLGILVDENHLFHCIGNEGDESVFTRTFSILVVVLILIRHRKNAFLDYPLFIETKTKIIKYYLEEKDLRGYTDEHGWAHGAAHGADALDELVQCRECEEEILQEILDSIRKVLYNGKYSFCNEEDERITRVVFRMIRLHGATSSRMIGEWLNGLDQCCEWEKTHTQRIARTNAKNFIRCLYFKLLHNRTSPDLIDILLHTEERLNRFLQIDKDM